HEGRGPALNHLEAAKPSAPSNELLVDVLRLSGKDVLLQPFHQHEIIGDPSEQDHRHVSVSVDQAGHHDFAGRVDRSNGSVPGDDLGSSADCHYSFAPDSNRAVLDHTRSAIHRDDGPSAY